MVDKMIDSLSFTRMVNLIIDARARLLLAMPFIHSELSEALVDRIKLGGIDLRVAVGLSEDNIRNGYGDIGSIEMLREHEVPVLDSGNSLISFIIRDDEGYLLFPQSRFFSSGDDVINALRLEPVMMVRLIQHFFTPSTSSEKERLLIELVPRYFKWVS